MGGGGGAKYGTCALGLQIKKNSWIGTETKKIHEQLWICGLNSADCSSQTISGANSASC